MIFRSRKKKQRKAQETVIKLEEAAKPDQGIAKENKTTEEKTVVTNNKSVAYDVKYQQLLDVMGKDKLIISGQIFTNKNRNLCLCLIASWRILQTKG